MKILATLAILSISTFAQASYYSYTCASADGMFRWENSHGDATFYGRYYGNDGTVKTAEFDFHDVNIKQRMKKTIKKENLGRPGCYWGDEHTYYAKTTITPSPEIKDEFESKLGRKVEGHFICLDHKSGEASCE